MENNILSNQKNNKSSWFWQIIRHFAPLYLHVGIASLMVNLFALAMPLFVMNVYDRIVPNNAFESLWVLTFGIVLTLILDFVLRNARAYFVDTAGRNTDVLLMGKFMDIISDIRLDVMPNTSVGGLLAKVREFEYIREFMGSTTLIAFLDLPFILLYILLIGLLGGWLVLVPLCFVPIMLFSTFIVQNSFKRATQVQLQDSVKKNALLGEIAAGFETMRATRLENALSQRWDTLVDTSADSTIKAKLLGVFTAHCNLFLSSLSSVLLVFFGVYTIASGAMSMGSLIACVILLGRCIAPLTSLVNVLSNLHKAKLGLESLNNLMQMPRENPHEQNRNEIDSLFEREKIKEEKNLFGLEKSTIEDEPAMNNTVANISKERLLLSRRALHVDILFDNVSFRYPSAPSMDTMTYSLSNVNLRIAKGEHIALVGKTGSGKSTLTRLAAGLFLPTSGKTFYGAVEMGLAPMRTIRKNIGVLPQQVVLFSGTIRSNICDAWPDDVEFTENALLELATLCGIMDFASKHPLGLDMPIGEHGIGLSGGQAQAVALARALAGNPDIIVLDEPSSNLDAESEKLLIQRLQPYLIGKTLIIATHRNSMLHLVDKVVTLEDGRITNLLQVKKVTENAQ